MLWQDIVIMIVSVVLSLALVPQVYYGFKEKKGPIAFMTSVPTFLGLYVICFAYFTLGLYLSAVIGMVTSTLWLVLFIQRWVYKKD
ncbi:MAG: hypothetical protein WCT11_03510 [Candidatus Magasanikbacteria bacterium]